MDLNVRGLALSATQRLVDHDLGVGQRRSVCPWSPAANKKAPMLAAMPMHSVETSGLMNCMVSKIDMPALTLPPGELMYSEMSLSGILALQEEQLGHHQVGRHGR